jgi:hypothetical protein
MRCPQCPATEGNCPGEEAPQLCARAALDGQDGFRRGLARIALSRSFPTLGRQALNLMGAVGRFVASGLATASPELRAERMVICEGCDRFVGGRCSACGCRLAAKVAMQSESCPIQKW